MFTKEETLLSTSLLNGLSLSLVPCPLSLVPCPPSEVMSPSTVTVSESGVNSARVSWGPLQPEAVQSYKVEYSALPGGKLHIVTTGRWQNSTVLTNLQPDTQYLVTVSARYSSGKERAMSVKMCTQEGKEPGGKWGPWKLG